MAVRRRRTQLPPSPQRQEYHEGTQAIRDSGWMTPAGTAIGGALGALGGGIAGGFAGAAATGPMAGWGAVPGALTGAALGASAGAGLGATAGASFEAMDVADYESGQAELDRKFAREMLERDMQAEQSARDYANRMSTLGGISMTGLPQPRAAGYKWGNFRS